jgi:hypothetical protein
MAVVGRLYVVLVKAVADAIIGVWTMGSPFPENVSFRALIIGEAPLMESMDADGDSPSLKDLRLRF